MSFEDTGKHRKTPANPTPQYRMETQLSKVTQQKRHMKTHSYSCLHSQKQTHADTQENPSKPNNPVQDGNSTFKGDTSKQTVIVVVVAVVVVNIGDITTQNRNAG